MSFANEFQKLKNLRDSGSITREEYEAYRNRLLEDCVRRIESVHDRIPKPSPSGTQPTSALNHSGETSSQSQCEPHVKLMDTAVVAKRSSTYSGELDYSLVKPPARRGQVSSDSSATAYALARSGVESVPSAPSREDGQGAVSPEPSVPRVKFSAPPPFAEPDRSQQPTQPVEAVVNESPAFTPAQLPSVRVAYETVKINPAALLVDNRQHAVSPDGNAKRPPVSTPPPAEDLKHSVPTPPTPSVEAFQVENRVADAPFKPAPIVPAHQQPDPEAQSVPVSSLLRSEQLGYGSPKSPAHVAVKPVEIIPPSPPSEPDAEIRPVEAASAAQAEEVSDPVAEEFLPRFVKPYDTPAERNRWGLPRFKLVTGAVQDVRLSLCQNSEAYAASVNVDGQRMEITSSSEILITAGDRVSLGGYERDGQLLVLGYRNETNGSHSDLSRLRKRYRFLLTAGRLSLLVGLAVLAATVMLFLHKPLWASHLARWGYVPYVLSGLVAAAVSYVGLALSFVGKWAKEFHSALAPASGDSEPAPYDPSSLPLALN